MLLITIIFGIKVQILQFAVDSGGGEREKNKKPGRNSTHSWKSSGFQVCYTA